MSNKKTKAEKRQTLVRVLAIVLAALLIGTIVASVLPLFGLAEEAPQPDSYQINMAVDLTSQAIAVDQRISWINRTGRRLTALWLNVYPNTLRRTATTPVEYDSWNNAFPGGYAPGGVDFMGVQVNGESALWAMSGEGEQFMRIACDVNAGETVDIALTYHILLTVNSISLGIGQTGWRLTNFYPIVAHYDEATQDFVQNAWTLVTDPLMSDVANYELNVILPDGWQLYATGSETREDAGSGYAMWHANAQSVRSVSMCFCTKLVERTATAKSGLTIRAAASTSGRAQSMLDAAVMCVNLLEDWLGELDIDTLDVVEADLYSHGVSKPGLIMLPTHTATGDKADIQREVARLCAGQWFGALVGNDPEREPWLSETLCAYVSLLCTQATQGRAAYLKLMNGDVLAAMNITIPGGLYVDSAASRFSTLEDFDAVVRDRGCAVFHELRDLMGSDVFVDALRLYVSQNRGENASIAQFAQALDEASGSRWDEYLTYELQHVADTMNPQTQYFE